MFKWFKRNKQNNTIPFIGELCEHDYIYYNRAEIPFGFGYAEFEYRFICKKCERDFKVTEHEISDLIDGYKEIYKKNIALGRFKEEDFEKVSFRIIPTIGCCRLYEGRYLNLFIKHFKSINIDIKSIQAIGDYNTQLMH